MNHYPVIGRRVPASCKDAGGTADPHTSIDCPKCRARVKQQVAAKRAGAMSFAADSQERPFFLKNADALERVLLS